MAGSSFIARFFSGFGRLLDSIGTLLMRLLLLIVLLVVLLMIVSGPDGVEVPDGGILVLAPEGAVMEQATVDPVSAVLGAGLAATELGDIIDALDRAANDDRIQALVLQLEKLTTINPAQMESIGAALGRFRESGKPIFAHAAFYSQAQYALASYADTISLHPLGNLLLPGYGGSQLFFTGLLDRLRVNMHIFRVGTHKAAVEPYMLQGFSDEARANNQQLVSALWERYLATVQANRSLDAEALRDYTDNYAQLLQQNGGDMAQLALDHGLVDELNDDSRFHTSVAARVVGGEGSVRRIGLEDYLLATRPQPLLAPDSVGVIVAQGTIMLGEQPLGAIGADSLGALIRHARQDDSIKAVVLRVDSPGGAALASEMIRQELLQVREAGKPVIVSMGGTAASGGYWIAAAADQIWASPVTITGSIGVLGMVPTFEESLAEIGITSDGVGTTPLSLTGDPLSGLNGPMQQILQASVEDAYQKFLQLVADSRGLSLDEVDRVAQGQVWTGEQALELGLVDSLGDLPEAIAAAAELAQLEEFQVIEVQRALTPGELFIQQMVTNFTSTQLSSLFGFAGIADVGLPWTVLEQLQQLLPARDQGLVQLQLLCEICVSLR